MVARLDYVTFYRGNFVEGYDYYYLKRYEGHAFLQFQPRGQAVRDITSSDFDYYNPHYNQMGQPFNWRYQEEWTDLTQQWDDVVDQTLGYIQTWMREYHGPTFDHAADNDEWGVRFKRPGQVDEVIWGLNAFPANLADFEHFLQSLRDDEIQS
jgi:hypothetical protein